MGYIKNLLDRLLEMQDRFRSEAVEYYREGEGRVSLLRVVGMSGETLLLKEEGGRIRYAEGNENPVHVFRCSEDTFLDLLANETTIRREVTLGHFTIEDASSGEINLVEMEKWAKAFERLRGLISGGLL
ncbi:MAG: hypothetical protein ACE5Z5_07070 [Candidatus Bathyarchaeia archaeon]